MLFTDGNVFPLHWFEIMGQLEMLQMEVISNPYLSMSIFVFSHLCYGFVICGVLGCDTKGSKLDLQNT
jgi:hypothetical protein